MGAGPIVSGGNGNDNSGGDGVFNGGDFRVIRWHGVIQSAETQAHHVHPVRYRRIYGCDYRRRGSGVVDPGCPEDFVISEKRAGSHTGYGGERRRYLVPSRFGRDKGPVPDLVRSIAHRLRMREKVYVIASHDHFAIRESRLPFRISGGGRQGTACEHRMREIDAGVYDPYLRAASGLRSSSCFVPQALCVQKDGGGVEHQSLRPGKVNLSHAGHATHATVVLHRNASDHRVHNRIQRTLNLDPAQTGHILDELAMISGQLSLIRAGPRRLQVHVRTAAGRAGALRRGAAFFRPGPFDHGGSGEPNDELQVVCSGQRPSGQGLIESRSFRRRLLLGSGTKGTQNIDQ